MVTIRNERSNDIAAREACSTRPSARAFRKDGRTPARGALAAEGLSFVAVEQGRLVGTARLWHVSAGIGRPALLLGPLAVATEARGRGIGTALVTGCATEARRLGHRADPAGRRCAVLRPLRFHGRRRPVRCACPARTSRNACSASS